MAKYTKKVVEFDAFALTTANLAAIQALADISQNGQFYLVLTIPQLAEFYPDVEPVEGYNYAVVPCHEGLVLAEEGDYIIKCATGYLSVKKPAIFNNLYQLSE